MVRLGVPSSVEVQIEIKASAERLFVWLTDPQLKKRWMKGLELEEIIEKTDSVVGSTFLRVVNRDDVLQEYEGEIVLFNDNRALSLELATDKMDINSQFRLDSRAEGTLLTHKVDLMPRGLARFFSFFLLTQEKNDWNDNMEEDLERLRELVEDRTD